MYLATACNEVVNISNIKTGEIAYQIYDKEAIHGTVTALQSTNTLLAIGYSSGTILVYDLDLSSEADFELIHQFSFHRSAITTMIFSDENTQLISGGADSYIVLYDLVTSTAEYKLMGHSESISQLQTLVTKHPVRGTA